MAEQYPEHAKQKKILKDAETIGHFLDANPYILAEWCEIEGYSDPQLIPAQKSYNQILADHFDIDLNKINAEKNQMLEDIRKTNDAYP